jgi:hypothetical protein
MSLLLCWSGKKRPLAAAKGTPTYLHFSFLSMLKNRKDGSIDRTRGREERASERGPTLLYL